MARENRLTRRQFLTGAGVASLAVAGTGLVGCSAVTASNTTSKTQSVPVWEQIPNAIPAGNIKKTVSAEVVIVGAGIAGCCAAMSAAQAGLHTVVVQKGGAVFNYATGVASYDTKQQKAAGAPDKYDVEQLISGFMANATNIPDRQFIELWRKRSGSDMDWLYDLMLGTEIDPPTWDWTEDEPIMGMFNMIAAMPVLAKMAQEKGVEFYYNTPAVQLERKNAGRVTAVIAKNENGDYQKFEASKAVVLCAGDYGNNPEMRAEFMPHAEGFQSAVYPAYNTGDGELMAMWVGAAMDKKPHCTNIHYDLIDGTLKQIYGAGIPWLRVNKNGERFSNEDVIYGLIPLQDASQPGCVHIDIFDADYETYQPLMGDGLYRSYPTAEDTAPVFLKYLDNQGIDHSTISDYTAMLEAYVKLGTMFKADTIEGLAKQINVPGDALKMTVDRYNKLVDAGKDKDYGKSPDYLYPIKKAPFYGVPRQAYSLSCLSGLAINYDCQVLDTDGNVISGLYACGNNSGGRWFAGLVQPMNIPGVPSSRAVITARVAIENIAKQA